MLALDDRIFTKYYYSRENNESEMARRLVRSGSELFLLNWSGINWK